MKNILTIILCLSLTTHQTQAMGSKENSLQNQTTTDIAPSTSKVELAKKVSAALMKAGMPDDLFSKLAQPIQDELKKSWNVQDAFGTSLKTIDQQVQTSFKPFLGIITDIYAKALAAKFSENELKELQKIYENPVMQKATTAILSWVAEEGIRAMKDPKVTQEYTQQFTGLIAAAAITGMQSAATITSMLAAFSQDAAKALAEAKIDFVSEESRAAFRNKFAQVYPSIANFAGNAQMILQDGAEHAKNIGTTLPTGN